MLLCNKNCIQRTLKLPDQALINHEMAELGILLSHIVWPLSVGLNVTFFPTMLLSESGIDGVQCAILNPFSGC